MKLCKLATWWLSALGEAAHHARWYIDYHTAEQKHKKARA